MCKVSEVVGGGRCLEFIQSFADTLNGLHRVGFTGGDRVWKEGDEGERQRGRDKVRRNGEEGKKG